MIDKYTYSLLGALILAPLLCILWIRKDLAHKAVKAGLVGGGAGLVSEFFYFKDYWRPPSLRGIAAVSVEDFIFGFAITSLSLVIYLWLSGGALGQQVYPTRHRLYLVFFGIGLGVMLYGNLYARINSIFVSSAAFVGFTIHIFWVRRDLIKVGLYSAAAICLFTGVVYILLFNAIYPEFWQKYWLLADTKWGVTVLGNVPVTEMIWYASWGLFASVSYFFVSGRGIIKTNKSKSE